MADEADDKALFPAHQVLDTLISLAASSKEKTAEINGALGDRLRVQYELNSDFSPFAWGLIKKLTYVGMTNELKAREMIRVGHAALDAATDWLDRHGHAGDIAEMARKAAIEPPKADAGPAPTEAEADAAAPAEKPAEPDPVKAQVESNVVNLKGIKEKKPKEPKAPKADKPKDSVDAVREQLKADKKKGAGTFVEEQREETAKGDALIKEILDERKPDTAEAGGGVNNDDEDDGAAPATAEAEPEQEREREEKPDKAAHGRYSILS